jgi:WD40 repeat protein
MKKRLIRTMVLSFLLMPSHTAVIAASPPLATIRTGHTGAIASMTLHQEGSLLYSAGEDGKLMVWDVQTGRLLQSIRADRLPIRAIAAFPGGEHVALYAGDGRREHRISVWNWTTGELEYAHVPEDEVLWMEVSPYASYLVYSVPRLRSIQILDALSGRQLPFLRQTTGIVNWLLTATGEERLLTYSASTGLITYRNIVTGSVAAEFEAPEGLKRLTLLEQRRFAAAETADGLLAIVDLLSGEIVQELRVGEIESIQRDLPDGDVLVVTRSFSGSRTIRRYRFRNSRLQPQPEPTRSIPDNVETILISGNEMFGSTSDGRILRWPARRRSPETFSRPILAHVTDVHLADDRLYLMSTEQVISVSIDVFSQLHSGDEPIRSVQERVTLFDAGRKSRFITNDRDGILMWVPEKGVDALQLLNPLSGRTQTLPVSVPPGVVAVSADDDDILMLSRAGLLVLVDRHSGTELFSYRGSGFQTAIRTDREIFLGKAFEGGVLDSSILRLDPRTGETVPLETSTRLVFFLAYDESRGRLFSIGLSDDQSGRTSTVIEIFEGPNYGRRRVILQSPGEYLDAQVFIDPVQGSAYTTLDDRGGIRRWDGARVIELSRNQSHIPRRLVLGRDYLYSVNWDGTVSLVDRMDGAAVLDIALVGSGRTGEWLVLRPDGRFFVSRDRLLNDRVISINSDELDMGDLVIESTGW